MRAYNQPVNWWGWHWEPPVPLSIVEIVKAGSMSARLAALFWMGMERGASVIIAADPPSSGKTTILTAFLGFLPPQAGVYFTRGIGESFDLPPLADAQPFYILINEISDHLPVYTWGSYARRAFQLASQGYSLGSTMHADTPQEVVQILEQDLGIPPGHIAHLTFIATVHLSYQGGR
ncbi:MAG: type II secretion system protein E, partial [Dehalococcoidia bacterium]